MGLWFSKLGLGTMKQLSIIGTCDPQVGLVILQERA